MMVKIFFASLLIFCYFQACLSDVFFYCDNVQNATVGESFMVKCNSSSQLWSRVQYLKGKEESLIVFIRKDLYGVLRYGGSEYTDGTVNITAEGILVFNSVTWNDSGEYKLEYFDLNGYHYAETFTIEVQDPKAAVTERSTSLTKHEITTENFTEIRDLLSTYPELVPVTTATETLPPSTTHVTTKSTEIVTTSESSGASTTVKVVVSFVVVSLVVVLAVIVVIVLRWWRRSKERCNPQCMANSTHGQPGSDAGNSDNQDHENIPLQNIGGE